MPEDIVSMEEDMSAIFDDIQERDLPDEAQEKSDRHRDKEGKFAKSEEAETPKEEKLDKPDKAVTQDKVTESQEKPESVDKPKVQADAMRPPSSWSAAAKAKFAQMDSDVQKEVIKREEDFHKGIDGYKARAALGDTLYKEIAPYEAMIRSQGSTPEVSIRNLLGVAYQLSVGTPQQKQQVIANIAQMYGVQMSTGEEMPQVDPTVAALQQEVQKLRAEREQEKYQRETSTTATLSDEIAAFQADPANIYFENVKAHMSALLQGGRATGLKDAYEQATWANPEVRQQLLAQQQKDAELKRLDEAKKTAIEAKRSAPINSRAKGVFSPVAQTGNSITDTMSNVYDEIQSSQ